MANFDFLLGSQTDPMRQMGQFLTLAQLSRQNRMGQEDENARNLERQSDMLAANAYTKARQSGDFQAALTELSQQGEAGALATRKLVDFAQKQAKADADVRYRNVESDAKSAGAEKDRASIRLDGLKQFATLGTAIASGQAPVNETTQSAAYEIARAVLPAEVVRTMPSDPGRFKEWMTVVASPESLSKIAREAQDIEQSKATTAKTALETQQMPAELAVRQRNADSQRISANASATSAGASASNAATARERLAFDQSKDARDIDSGKWVNDIQGGVQINMNTGETRPITSNGQPVGAKKDPALALQNQQKTDMADRVLSVIEDMKPKVGFWNNGLVGGATRVIPGSGAFDFARQADTIKANLGFEQLQALRAASPTGGALGAVSDQENKMLQSAVAALDTAQSPAQFRANLEQVEKHLRNVKDLIARGSGGQGAAPSGWGKASVVGQ